MDTGEVRLEGLRREVRRCRRCGTACAETEAEAATGCGPMIRWSSARIESRLSRLGRAIHSTLFRWTRAGWSSLSERGGRRRPVHQLVEAVRMHVRSDPTDHSFNFRTLDIEFDVKIQSLGCV
jgi:hypothetical protein